jgi:hypothetical protein
MEWGLDIPRTERWVWPKLEPFKGYTRFLRIPGPEQGLGYRVMRIVVIAALRVKALTS